MVDRFLEKASQLSTQEESFAIAIVVRRTPPASARAGDKAIILADGTLWGWTGGGCTRDIVIREALAVLAEGRSRLVRISPESPAAESGVSSYSMSCHSGGSMEIYIEPILPRPRILVFGTSPVAMTLAALARVVNYGICIVASKAARNRFPEVDEWLEAVEAGTFQRPEDTFVVVATQGVDDVDSLRQAVQLRVPYIGFVASRKKALETRKILKEAGLSESLLDRIRAPAGLDIQARSPEEIAASILAEIIQVRRSRLGGRNSAEKTAVSLPEQADDPVCGMKVDPVTARFQATYEGTVYSFCGDGCRQRFEAEPEVYVGLSRK